MESPEGFQLIISFVIFPLFFLSGSLFPITNLPKWLAPFIFFNPVTYAVDGIRGVLLGISQFSLLFDLALVSLFALSMILIGTYAFKKMKI
jgi:ABC-2 type transport system permease protein